VRFFSAHWQDGLAARTTAVPAWHPMVAGHGIGWPVPTMPGPVLFLDSRELKKPEAVAAIIARQKP
jgi:hypothetical protein